MQAFRARQKKDGYSRVTANFAPREYERLSKSAAAHNEKPATHLKTLALAQLDQRYLVPPDIAERLDTLLVIMRGIGTNLNQMARHSNEMRAFLETREIQPYLKSLDDAVRQFVAQPPKK